MASRTSRYPSSHCGSPERIRSRCSVHRIALADGARSRGQESRASFTRRSLFWHFVDSVVCRFKAQPITPFAGSRMFGGWSPTGCGNGSSACSIGKFASIRRNPAGHGFPALSVGLLQPRWRSWPSKPGIVNHHAFPARSICFSTERVPKADGTPAIPWFSVSNWIRIPTSLRWPFSHSAIQIIPTTPLCTDP